MLMLVFENHGHPPPLKIKRDFVYLAVLPIDVQRVMQFSVFQYGEVQEVFQPRLIIAVEIGPFQHFFIFLAQDIQVSFQYNFINREGTGLVGTEDVHRADILDSVQSFDDDLSFAHIDGPLGQVGGDDHRKHFRRQPDGYGDSEQQGFEPVTFREAVDQEDQGHHNEHKSDKQPADAVDSLVKTCFRPFARDGLTDRAEIGKAAGGHGHGHSGAADDVGTHEAAVFQFKG